MNEVEQENANVQIKIMTTKSPNNFSLMDFLVLLADFVYLLFKKHGRNYVPHSE
jgi:hypothetical protein